MSTLKEFTEKVLSPDRTFLLEDGHGKILCVKVPIGQAKYIYTMREYLAEKELVTDITDRLELTAIYKNREIYIFNPYNVMDYLDEKYPENVYYVNDNFLEKINDQIKEKVIDKLYGNLPTVPLTENKEVRCREEARHILIYKVDFCEYENHRQNSNIGKIDRQKFADNLCGVINLENEAKIEFYSKKEMWIKLKSSLERIKEIISTCPEIALKKYEQDIANSLNDIEAKTVQVEFLYDGTTASAKIVPNTLLRMIDAQDYFSSYNFVSMKSGEKLIADLGAGKYSSDKKEPLKIKHIQKITYGKKILYQRTEE